MSEIQPLVGILMDSDNDYEVMVERLDERSSSLTLLLK